MAEIISYLALYAKWRIAEGDFVEFDGEKTQKSS